MKLGSLLVVARYADAEKYYCNPSESTWTDLNHASCDDWVAEGRCDASGWVNHRLWVGFTFEQFSKDGYHPGHCVSCGCDPSMDPPGTGDSGAATVFPCPSSACWSYDEDTHACTMTGDCATLSCGATGFDITFESALFNLDDGQTSTFFSGGLFPTWDGSQWVLNAPLGESGMAHAIDADSDA